MEALAGGRRVLVRGTLGRGREQTCSYHHRLRSIHIDGQVRISVVTWPGSDSEPVVFGAQLSFHVSVFDSGTRGERGEERREEIWVLISPPDGGCRSEVTPRFGWTRDRDITSTGGRSLSIRRR